MEISDFYLEYLSRFVTILGERDVADGDAGEMAIAAGELQARFSAAELCLSIQQEHWSTVLHSYRGKTKPSGVIIIRLSLPLSVAVPTQLPSA
jgi:hypothetical protein